MERKEEKRFNHFLKAQQKFINDAKYFEGINIHKDPGESYIINWITKNAKNFRTKWEVSKCKDCEKSYRCGDKLRTECEEFEELK
ncbi:MAG: hypothetical protein QXG00_07615 [Candidatus Woesearchaeota archaeon]